MSIDKNNNRGVVWRVAGSNLMGNKLHSFFTVLTIILAVSLISGLAMVQKSGEKEKQPTHNKKAQPECRARGRRAVDHATMPGG